MKAFFRSTVLPAFVIASAVFVALGPLWPVYGTGAALVVAAAGVVLGALIAIVAVRWRWSLLTTSLATLAVFGVVGVPLAIPSKTLGGVIPTIDGLSSLAASVVLSWKQLVTVVTPVASYEALLVPVLIVTLVSSAIGVTLALRPKARSLAALPPLVALGLAIWLGPVRGFESLLIAGVVFVLLAVWFSLSGPRGARGILRALGVVAIPMLIATVLLTVIAPAQRTVWRALIEQPFVLQADTSPLAEYRSYVSGSGATNVLLNATGLSAGSRVTLATLDSYNGVVYSVGGTAADFTRVPGIIPTDAQQGETVDSRITISNVSGPWVPLPAELGSIAFEGAGASALTGNFYYSRTAATGAVMGGLQAGDTYAVRGVAHPLVSVADIRNLTPGAAEIPAPSVIPDGIDAFATTNAQGTTVVGQRLSNVLAALLADGYVSNGAPGETASRSGHGAERITQLFTETPMVGDGEQYAVAAALLANEVGFPARVVMGMVVPAGASAGDVGVSLTGATMSAWIEISTKQGWVAVDTNPVLRPIPEQLPDDPTTVSRPQSAAEPPPQDVPRLQDQTAPEAAGGEVTPPVDPFQALLGTIVIVGASSLLVLGLLVAPFLSVIALKARRRARRRSTVEPRDRVHGAWAEFADSASDHGIVLPDSATRREMARLVPAERSVPLAKLADRVQFSPGAATDAQAEEAWRFVDQVRAGLDASNSRTQRLRSLVALNSLRHTAGGRLLIRFTARRRPRG